MSLSWIAVGVGGALGSLVRHAVNVATTRLVGHPSYTSTLIVNVVGCAIIGLLAGQVAAGRLDISPTMRLFVFVGVLGGFTTFSSFGLDTLTLVQAGRHYAATFNVIVQLVVGLLAVSAGHAVGQRL
jgi:fluoride exporter